MDQLLTVFLVLGAITVSTVGVLCFVRYATIVDRWAARNAYRIIKADAREFFQGPFFMRSSTSEPVYRVTVADRNGNQKSGLICCSGWLFGPDRVVEMWDDGLTHSSENCRVFDYFVCSQAQIGPWAESFASGDEHIRENLEAEMPGFAMFRGIGPDEIRALAQCVTSDQVEAAVDLVRAVGRQDPTIFRFRQPVIAAIATMLVDEALLQRWVSYASKVNGKSEADNWQVLRYGTAAKLKELCTLAVNERLGVFAWFYG